MVSKDGFHQSQVQWDFVFFLKEDALTQMHRISLEVIIYIFKPVDFITIYSCFDKPSFCHKSNKTYIS